MSTNHNRIKVSDLEKNLPNKVLTTNTNGELEFNDITNLKADFLNKDIILSNYPNTRNDGVNPTNKFLGTDANGNIKSYSFATFPAPYLTEFLPNFNLPNTTGYLTLKGSFFTPNMTVDIAGQSINLVSFINDNEIKIHMTTSAIGGFYNITLNNGGGDTVFVNRFFVTSGSITEPSVEEWENIGSTMDVSLGKSLIMTSYGNYNSFATWNKVIDYTKTFSVFFSFDTSPLGVGNIGASTIDVIGVNTGTLFITTGQGAGYNYCKMYAGLNHQFSLSSNRELWKNSIVEYRYVNGFLSIYIDGVYNFPTGLELTENVKLKFNSLFTDIVNIKYVEY